MYPIIHGNFKVLLIDDNFEKIQEKLVRIIRRKARLDVNTRDKLLFLYLHRDNNHGLISVRWQSYFKELNSSFVLLRQ